MHENRSFFLKGLSTDIDFFLFRTVSRRARTSPFPMITVEEAHSIISQYAQSLDVIEMPLSSDLIGYVLAEDIQAKEAVPAYRASIVDGYAVHGKINK